MVASTPTLQSLRLFPKIHQPLPLNTRESQRLLDSITTSFRKNLDKEHPWQSSKSATLNASAAHSEKRSRHAAADVPPIHPRPTDQHLRAILSNPLFATPGKAQAPRAQGPQASGFMPGLAPRDPAEVFDAAVAKGLMTLPRAAGFLEAVVQEIAAAAAPSTVLSLGGTGAGLRVVQWLRASGQEESLDFLSRHGLINRLIPFMYAEGLEEVAWAWLDQLTATKFVLLEFDSTHSSLKSQPVAILLLAMLKATSHPISNPRACLDDSYAALARAGELLAADDRIASASLRQAWQRLSWASTVEAIGRPKPSAPMFESFVDRGRVYKPNEAKQMALAHLELHHPTMPSSDAAVQYMNRGVDAFIDKVNQGPAKRTLEKRWMVCLALDAARQLEATGNTVKASWVETLVTRMYENFDLGLFTSTGHLAGHAAGGR